MEFENGAQEQPKVVGGKLFWSTSMDDCMLEVFLCHLAQGRRTPSGWKKNTTYNAIREALLLNLRLDVSVNQIENRVKTLRSQVMAYRTLNTSCGSSSSGFGWDAETMQLTADERVWDEALKANPSLKNYKKKVLPRFNEWMDVLGDNSANGNIQKTVGPHAENLKRCFLRVPAHLQKNWLMTKLKELNLLDDEHVEGGDHGI